MLSTLTSLWVCVSGGKLPEPEVKTEVVHKPLMCYRKTKYGDMLLVHYEGFLESNGTMFHSSWKEGDRNPVWRAQEADRPSISGIWQGRKRQDPFGQHSNF
ncbi:unnamed protein product [Pleuronectes platessa]|uniref:PPIase FKBP-type domain-containing protein n=1 Tax=Pleuronectes platessa TaxID=8262 RepID=A0A9N7Z1M7_PLEPL|nr:unnamed protein product [Pleuronectes platessa]